MVATETSSRGLKRKKSQEEVDHDTREAKNRCLVCSEVRRFFVDPLTLRLPGMFVWSDLSFKNQLKARGYYKQLVNHVCSRFLEQLERKELVPCDAPWSVWTLHLAMLKKTQAMVKLDMVKRQTTSERKKNQENTMLWEPRMEFVFTSMVERTAKQKPGVGGGLLSKTVSPEQLKILDEST